eukprot:TRINITY_DN28_c4_g1_i1.p1 TRINITY_DN28_c4_g1~~TRINITY_DN28_c4_g1_i1.p1  ORF type:complete len:768 (+),score=193.79 TRINITY_DN28_c4_g1_i1:185-2488(+)
MSRLFILVLLVLFVLPAAVDAGKVQGASHHVSSARSQRAKFMGLIRKVVKMLSDMQAQLTQDRKDDEDNNKALECWCKTTKEEKGTAIQTGTEHVERLKLAKQQSAAKIAELTTKAKALKEDIEKGREALQTASALRSKDAKAFNDKQEELMDAIGAIKSGLSVLKRASSDLLEVKSIPTKLRDANVLSLADPSIANEGASKGLRAFLSALQTSHADTGLDSASALSAPLLIREALRSVPQELTAPLMAYRKKSGTSFLAIEGEQSGPMSGVLGFLTQMADNFQEDLEKGREEEAAAVKAYEAMKASKYEEVAAGKDYLERNGEELSSERQVLAETNADLEDTERQLKLDESFLKMLIKKCKTEAEAYKERREDGLHELEALTEVIYMLDNDQTFDLTNKLSDIQVVTAAPATPPAFLQMSSRHKHRHKHKHMSQLEMKREQAADVLQKSYQKTNDPELALLSLDLRSALEGGKARNNFEKIIFTLKRMVKEIERESTDEQAKRDKCVVDVSNVKKRMALLYVDRDKIARDLKAADKERQKVQKQVDEKVADIKKAEQAVATASENRKKESREYRKNLRDQEMMIEILKKAALKLKTTYNFLQAKSKKRAQERQQQQQHPLDGAPTGKEYRKQKGAGNAVIAMMDTVIEDARKTSKDTIKSEQDAQTNYNVFTSATTKEIMLLDKAKTELDGQLLIHVGMVKMVKKKLNENMKTLEETNRELQSTTAMCNPIIFGFPGDQAGRNAEIEGLQTAKGLLSGFEGIKLKR